ncbi:hypothetical protein [Ramlibacter alkalitolerans]|uniref:Uncharacterized protein n=1 Tax=Ramlibacter alkalitolerans TaxID=2039631 RepID=A0ABS1JTR7_9BURK|nr:hypothetical protein [Ramlibacter alkalitolerans]MBL0427699.1 hypothetical protein [Ramlibacter alkalitolerans]
MATPTCIAHACALRYRADGEKGMPILEPATVIPNPRDTHRLDFKFADGSELVVQFAQDGPCRGSVYLAWGDGK